MGYLRNHLATVVCGAFAAALTVAWAVMAPAYPILEFVFIMAVPITWFLVLMCWLAQKSADYAHSLGARAEKKSLSEAAPAPEPAPAYLLSEAKEELTGELERLEGAVKLKDAEIGRLRGEIASLQTLVQIESLKSELANLKVLASRRG